MVRGTEYLIARISITILLAFLGIIMILPLIWMISSSFKIEKYIFDYPIRWVPGLKTFTFTNWRDLFTTKNYSVIRFYLNSIILAVG
ncbi:MAG: hypothetical protein AB1798_19835, partial [Spirochaetota bacterium]